MKISVRRAMWAGVALCVQTAFAGDVSAKTLEHLAGDEAREVAFLTHEGTADSLATASLLAHLVETRSDSDKKPDSTALIRRAAALAPKRPEIIWLLLRDCQLSRCAEEAAIVARLQSVDPDNGIALLPALRASQGGPPAETTRIISQIGASKGLSLYWNKSVVMLFDAMTHGRQAPPATAITQHPDDRLTHAAAVLAAVAVPPFKPITVACSSDQFQEAGRRTACESLMARLDSSDSIIAQSLSVSVQLKWWPSGSTDAAGLRRRHLQQEYLVQAAGRARESHVDADADLRVVEMRRSATEEEVDKAVLTAFGEPLERPADWHAPGSSGS